MYSITFKSDSKTALEYLRETAYEKIPEMDEMTVDQLDAMIKEPKERTHVSVCNNCGSDFLGTEALVDDETHEVVAGPYDNTQCLYCEDIDASVRVIPIDQIRDCENRMECTYSGDMEMMVAGIGIKERPANTKGRLCPLCANPSLETGMVWNLKESN
tara:strand:- start:1080 stop:1553 length:474 start_codon:yes stop_codon:yes gene_type:complete